MLLLHGNKMNSWDRLYSEFKVARQLESFRPPPCNPPPSKDVLEHFDVLYLKPKNERSANEAAFNVASELTQLWRDGDGRITLKSVATVKTVAQALCGQRFPLLHWLEFTHRLSTWGSGQ